MAQPSEDVLARAIGQRIRAARDAAGWTQAQLADAADVDRPNVARLEQGRHLPSLAVLWRVASALGLNLAHLVSLVPTEQPEQESPMVTMRNLTGWSPMYAMAPNGTVLAELPIELPFFYGGSDGIYTNDGSPNVRPFRLSDLPRRRANVRLLVRPEVARFVRDHSDRTDVTDGSTPMP